MILETLGFTKAVEMATPLAKKIFSSKIQPIIEKKIASFLKDKAAIRKFETTSVQYLAQIAGKCSTMNTIAFQNAPKKLEDLYVPLTLKSDGRSQEIKIDGSADIFKDFNHVLVNDTAGMGKSTLAKRIMLNVIAEGSYIPVFIELRQIEDKSIAHQIKEYFGLPTEVSDDVLNELPLLYVFDGLDEVPGNKKKEVIKHLKIFVEFAIASRILITSRQETYLSEFYSFSKYSIKRLDKEEAYNLLKNYDPADEVADKLISSLEDNESRDLHDFLATPLYVSLLFCAYRHKTVIPRRKDLFYSQVYDALFESHDLSKEVGYVRPKYSGLDSAEFHTVLRRLAFWCLKNNGRLEFEKDKLAIVMAELLGKISGIKASAPNFVKDLTSTVPLFVQEGPTIRWSHKSLMEYFAAMFICSDTKEKQKSALISLFKGENVHDLENVFELCSDIDFSTFRATIVKRILEDFIDYSSSAYTAITNKRIHKASVAERVRMMFGLKLGFQILNVDGLDGKTIFDDFFGNEKYRKQVLGKNPGKRWTYNEGLVGVQKKHLLYLSRGENESGYVLRIMEKKLPALFERFKYSAGDFAEGKLSGLETNHFYIINDDPKSVLNSSKNFLTVNKIIGQFQHSFLIGEEVIAELGKINSDESNGVDDLLDLV
ncbi:NACHT domain-containing protein [Massilia horti]|uniref:Short NACHT-associated C-terminal domain-containing protein n=1 Tax=Massilia horti TaxID=2562153 RepID=A0A4Y9SS65_9BURK|nr:hypothetical protein [Massilia horti]TFW29550.1 hypothetical protein E4O92_18560 [Massilia horti]